MATKIVEFAEYVFIEASIFSGSFAPRGGRRPGRPPRRISVNAMSSTPYRRIDWRPPEMASQELVPEMIRDARDHPLESTREQPSHDDEYQNPEHGDGHRPECVGNSS